MLHNWGSSGLPSLRKQVEDTLARTKRELKNRKSTGKTLDQAELRHKQTQQATELAATQLLQAQKSVALAEDALKQAKENEQQALAELTKLKATIVEQHQEVSPPAPKWNLPSHVVAGVYSVLQQAGLQPQFLA